jgi:hypothetical protein
MKQYRIILGALLFLVSFFCNAQEKIVENTYGNGLPTSNYLENRDLDGDGVMDKILFDFSGGAHCCYKMSLYLSSLGTMIEYPFEMDGGYVLGIDGSHPEHFGIEDYDQDGLPEIFMEIETYGLDKFPIDRKWTKKYGIKTNYILFDFFEKRMIVKDYTKKI